MAELTEQEIQEMIRKAREGDALANYQMSEWALEQAMAEPDEERWNTLAARCLVKAAEAGYEPAKERMEELIRDSGAAAPTEPREEYEPAPMKTARRTPVERPERSAEKSGASFSIEPVVTAVTAAFTKASDFVKSIFEKPEEAGTAAERQETETSAPEGEKKKGGGLSSILNISGWGDAQWKKAQRICLIAVGVLAVIIIIILLAGRGKKTDTPEPDAAAATPEATVEQTAVPVPTPTPEPVIYPDETVRSAIEAAELEVKPSETDYVTEATRATVKTNGGVLHVRKGNGTDYSRITSIPNGTAVDVFAYKGDWALVLYEGSYGWCSTKYLA